MAKAPFTATEMAALVSRQRDITQRPLRANEVKVQFVPVGKRNRWRINIGDGDFVIVTVPPDRGGGTLVNVLNSLAFKGWTGQVHGATLLLKRSTSGLRGTTFAGFFGG